MKRFFLLRLQTLVAISAFVLFYLALPTSAEAVSFTLYPERGYALLNKPFSVDILLDTEGEDLIEARAVFQFDPSRVQVTKAEYGDLFCQYPEEEYAVDNDAGWIKLSGYCNDPYYNSSGTPGLFGRFTFEPRMEGTVNFEFVETYDDLDWVSRALDTSSPPQEITGIEFTGGTYTLVSSVGNPDDGKAPGTKLPGVGIFDDKKILFGVFLFGLGLVIFGFDRVRRSCKPPRVAKERTIVVK